MGNNLVSCHSAVGKKGTIDPRDFYGFKEPYDPRVRLQNTQELKPRPEVHWESCAPNGVVINNEFRDSELPSVSEIYAEPESSTTSFQDFPRRSNITPDRQTYSSSAPSTPTSTRKNYEPPPKPPRLRSFAEPQRNRGVVVSFNCSDTMNESASLRNFVNDRHASHQSADITPGGSPSGSFVTMPTVKPRMHSSLLQLPILQITSKVFSLTKDILREMMDPDKILTQLTDNGVISPDIELKLMGCRTKQRRCDLLLDELENNCDDTFHAFCQVLRVNEAQVHLADLLEVHHTVIKNVCECRDRYASHSDSLGCIDEVFGSSDFLNEECAIFQMDINYCDSESGNMITAEEAKLLSTSIEDHFKEVNKYKRRSFYESIAIRDWNANYTQNRVIPIIVLDLYNQKLGNSGLQVLCNLLIHYSCIRELCLAKNRIDEHGVVWLGDALSRNHGLSKLDIRLNAFGDEGVRYIADGLKKNRSLRTLNVTCTGITGHGCNILADALSNNKTLTDLDVGFNDLRGRGCDALAEELRSNAYVKRLRMRRTNLDEESYSKLFKSLRINSRLQTMDISSNCISKSDASLLADLLVSNRTLQELNVEKCDIDVDGAACIARALKANTVLKTLDMSMNSIGDDGASSLADALKYNKTLECLCMNMCGITNIGFLTLLGALKVNQTLKTLKLSYNLIGHGDEDEEIVDFQLYYRTLELVYDRLGSILASKNNFKLLLWGNSLDQNLIPSSPTPSLQSR